MQPSLLTRQWLELHEAQFAAVKRELERELLKYELHAHGRQPLTGRLLCADPHASKPGVSLRRLLTDIQTLRARLAKHRPDMARRVVLPIDQDA
ncbi:hypothetical protein PINS_up010110 [Pythium insidiosum]|nr:hypothetical protein PINS_up010110 [Pythium insidiosum]